MGGFRNHKLMLKKINVSRVEVNVSRERESLYLRYCLDDSESTTGGVIDPARARTAGWKGQREGVKAMAY